MNRKKVGAKTATNIILLDQPNKTNWLALCLIHRLKYQLTSVGGPLGGPQSSRKCLAMPFAPPNSDVAQNQFVMSATFCHELLSYQFSICSFDWTCLEWLGLEGGSP